MLVQDIMGLGLDILGIIPGTTPSQVSSSDYTADQYLAQSGKDNHSHQATRKSRVRLYMASFSICVTILNFRVKHLGKYPLSHYIDIKVRYWMTL